MKNFSNAPCQESESCGEKIDEKELLDASKDRAKDQPLLQRIIKGLTRNNNNKFREIVISRQLGVTRVAVLVDGIMENFETDAYRGADLVGAIFKGRIQKLEDGLKAAFVITGQEKNAFLHYWDMFPAANDSFEVVSKNPIRSKITLEDIPHMYPVGAEVLVQISKAQMGTKGARVTTNITLTGRYLILTPFNEQCGISRKIENEKERERLKDILQKLTIPSGMGIIIRSSGSEKKLKFFIRDLSILLARWNIISKKASTLEDSGLVYQEPGLIGRAVRDFLTDDVDRIVTDSPQVLDEVITEINEIAPQLRGKVELYEEETPILEHFNVEKQVQRTFSRRLPLPSGGEIVLEETEALIAIDVNTSGHKAGKDEVKNFILQVNLEAALEIVRQMRLRNLGGLIIIDFIDMKNKADQKQVFDAMQELMAKDSARFQILPISPLGLMQITRQRHSQSMDREMRICCPYCAGRGTVHSPSATAIVLQLEILRTLGQLRKNADCKSVHTLKIFLHPRVLEILKQESRQILENLEDTYDIRLVFQGDETIHLESYKILQEF
ncbi:MAG: Rne/Rng family ribonuclease [Puniceicoccales bacterium]|jgi:ribonuclease G|nr:Rne/Rng family ribonuclease [Puniceicoccales bacterium]